MIAHGLKGIADPLIDGLAVGADSGRLSVHQSFGRDDFSGVSSDPRKFNTATLVTSLSCGDLGYLATDVATPRDCLTNLDDFSVIAASWMKCTFPGAAGCEDLSGN